MYVKGDLVNYRTGPSTDSAVAGQVYKGDGVVVLTTGADGGADRYGIYNICDAINEYIYKVIR